MRFSSAALGTLLLSLTAFSDPAFAQPPAPPDKTDVRMNRVIELMEKGQPAFGIFSQNLSPRTAASVSSSSLDFVIIDLEHSPFDLSRLETYLLGMTDRRQILKKGKLQPNVMPLVRVPSAGREHLLFVIKQVLDLGPFGLVIPHVDNAEDALAAVRASRFPQLRNVADYEPAGLRGVGYGWPARYWGLSGTEYGERADLWPLDPKGELLVWIMIETRNAVENCRAIAKTPGVGGLFIGPSDLAFSMGVPLGSPEVTEAMKTVLEAAREAGIPCGTLTGSSQVETLLQQGFQFLAIGGDSGLSGDVQEGLKRGNAFRKKAQSER